MNGEYSEKVQNDDYQGSILDFWEFILTINKKSSLQGI